MSQSQCHRKGSLGSSLNVVAAASVAAAEAGRSVGMVQRDWPAAETLLPFELMEGVQRCSTQKMDHVPQMDLGLVLHRQAVGLYMPLHHTNC